MRLPVALLAVAALLGLSPAAAQAPAPFSFIAFGDMPYCQPTAPQDCPAEEGRVARLMGAINQAEPAFAIFVGDTKGGSDVCTDARVLGPFAWMSLSNAPLVYTPGDNEWTDCWQDRGGRYDPLERLALIRSRFFADSNSLGRRPMPLLRQADTDPAHRPFVENARWTRNGVVFATLHVVGSNNNRPTEPEERPAIRPPQGAMAEFQARDAANIAWMEATFAEAGRTDARAVVLAIQADIFYVQRCGRGYDSGNRAFRAALGRAAASFGRPVLLINGDIHFWLHDRPMPEAPNLTRIMVPGDRETRAVRVAVDPNAADPWSFSLIGPDDRVMPNRC
ncbi:hypothetical protein [Falsiroseomonas oryzae]|uniref:hypothetical protein n=1 Tax=Falsiroseomonas oryzae TaxID=2766473 RepID=UPI0022EB91AD|nr:hypothetical protein [Roseomonas sp. MO-31]